MPLLNKEKKEEIKKAIGSGDTSKIKEVRKKQPLAEVISKKDEKAASSTPSAVPAKKPTQEELNEQLLEAVEGGVAQKVADALSAGADANARDKDGIPALANAVSSPEIVKLLLDTHADPNARFRFFGSILERESIPVLSYAAHEGELGTVDLLLNAGARVDERDSEDFTALMLASVRGWEETVERLLKAHADPKAKIPNGQDSLMLAAQCQFQLSSTKVARMLIKAGADPHATNSEGGSALKWAKFYKHREMIDLLKAARRGVRLD